MSPYVLEICGEVGNFGDPLRCNAFEVRLFGGDLGVLGIRCPVGDLGIFGISAIGILTAGRHLVKRMRTF